MRKTIRTCAICHGKYTGFGHNAQPVADGRCCDICQDTRVLPTRMDMALSESPAFMMFTRIVQDLERNE